MTRSIEKPYASDAIPIPRGWIIVGFALMGWGILGLAVWAVWCLVT